MCCAPPPPPSQPEHWTPLWWPHPFTECGAEGNYEVEENNDEALLLIEGVEHYAGLRWEKAKNGAVLFTNQPVLRRKSVAKHNR